MRRGVAIAQDRADAGADDAAVPDNEGAERLLTALGVLASQSHRLSHERVLVAGPPAHVAGHCRIIGTACRAMAHAEYAQLGNPSRVATAHLFDVGEVFVIHGPIRSRRGATRRH
jgi:hypothetical protein